MKAAIVVLALLFVTFVVLGAYMTVKVVGAAKRGVDRTVAQARRAVEDGALRAKQYAQPGALGRVAELRLSLRTSMRATQDALWAASPEDGGLAEARGLFDRLSALGHELDDDLKRLEREPDRSRIEARLPELREHTERIIRHADSLRWAAQDRARQFAGEDLTALERQIEIETGALRHWTAVDGQGPAGSRPDGAGAGPVPPGAADRGFSGPGSAGSGSPGSGAADPGAADPGAAGPVAAAGSRHPGGTADSTGGGGTGPAQAWPDVSRPDAVAQEPPGITARDARRETPYPWEKTRRPENTT
jgi:hypothetical protein